MAGARRIGHIVAVAVAVFVVNFFGFGLIDLVAGLIPGDDEWSVTNTAYGILILFYLTPALVGTLRAGAASQVARTSVWIVLASMMAIFLVSTRYDRGPTQEGGIAGFLNVGIIAIPSLIVLALQRRPPATFPAPPAAWLFVLLCLGAAAGLYVAVTGSVLQLRENDPYEAARNGYGGWSAWAAWGLSTTLLCTMMLRRSDRFTLGLLALGAIVYGAVGFANPDDAASLGVWSVLPVVFGLALAVAALVPRLYRVTPRPADALKS